MLLDAAKVVGYWIYSGAFVACWCQRWFALRFNDIVAADSGKLFLTGQLFQLCNGA
ncbi:hypothetical protein HMPREF3034_01722 [Prevotella sp. DNF00663]|nr:hypothetical protein HMPREF3034_01722 [Prevotella sp. DNF00663]